MGTEKLFRNVRVMGSLTVTSDITFEGMSASSDLDVIGDLQVDGNITSSGSMTIDNIITGTSAITATKLLTASSKSTLTKTVTVSSGINIAGNADVVGTLQVDGALTSSGTVTFDGLLTASSKSTLTGAVTASSDVTVTKTFINSSEHRIPVTRAATSNTIGAGAGLVHFTRATTAGKYNLATATTGAVLSFVAVSVASSGVGIKLIPATTTKVFLSSGGSTGRQAALYLTGDRMTVVGNTSGNWIVTSNSGVVFSAT